MKTRTTLLLSVLLGSIGAAPGLYADSYIYDANIGAAGAQDGAGTGWNTTNTNWWNGSADVKWPNLTTDSAVFGAGGNAGTVTVDVFTVQTNNITFAAQTGGNYQLLGGTITLGGTAPTIVANNLQGSGQVIRSTLIATSGFSKTGAGTLTFGVGSNLSGVSGTVDLSGGNVFLSETVSGSAAAAWNISASGTNLGLGVNGTVSLGSLSGVTNSVLRTAGSFSPTASIGALNTDTTFSGKITGTIAITKVGTGKLTLAAGSGQNIYTGATTISAGTLALASGGSIAKTPTITVESGAVYDVSAVSSYTVGFVSGGSAAAQTLKGSGTINGSTTIGAGFGTLIAGDVGTVGTLTFNNNLILAGTTSLDLIGVTAGTFDKISVGGTLTAGGLLQLVIGNGFATALNTAGGTATLDLFNISSASDFTSISLTGLDTGMFLTTTDGSSLVGATSGITYTWVGDGTLFVSAASIPEPSTAGLILGAAAMFGTLCGSRKRRR
jgi:autotransporter-associated beta strand protein